MKRFLKKCLLAGIILASFLLLVNVLYINTDYYKKLNGMHKFKNIPEHIDIANFGASHSESAFTWSVDKRLVGKNFAIGSQRLVYDEAWLDYYFGSFDQNSTVIIDIMFKSLYEKEPNEPPYDTSITRYYQVLPKKYIRQWNIKDALYYSYIPILGNRETGIEEIKKQVYSRFLKKENSDIQINNVSVSTTDRIVTSDVPTQVLEGWEMDAMNAEGQRRAASFMEQSGNQELGEQYDALIRIIEKCKKEKIQVILVTVPTLPCFYQGYTQNFMTQFYKDMYELCKTYDVTYLDYTGDERFLKDYRMFRDTDHLNSKGANFFTKQFLEDNKKLLKLE